MKIDDAAIAHMIQSLRDLDVRLLAKCAFYGADKGTNDKHRFVFSPVRVEVANGKVTLHRHADLTIRDHPALQGPARVVEPRVAEASLEVPGGKA